MPVQGLVKLAAKVAANKKKRKNALQIQKYIGEGRRGGGIDPNKRNPNIDVSAQKLYTQTDSDRKNIGRGKIGIDYLSADEQKKSAEVKVKNIKNPKKNISRNRAAQNMKKLQNMTDEEKIARKMRLNNRNKK